MKKNLLTIVILSLVVLNLIMTSIMMFTIVPANQKVNTLISQIASAIELDVGDSSDEEDSSNVSIDDIQTYTFEDSMTINLKKGEDGQSHMAVITVTLSMDKTNDDYSKYGEKIADNADLIKSTINSVVSSHTYEEMTQDTAGVQDEILENLQGMYDSTFIISVDFSSCIYQ